VISQEDNANKRNSVMNMRSRVMTVRLILLTDYIFIGRFDVFYA